MVPRDRRAKQIDESAVVVATLEKPPERLGVTHWSSRLLGREFGLGHATIARVWSKWNLQPWRVETFKFSTDPELDAKVRDVVGLYMHPPEKAVVVCVDVLAESVLVASARRLCASTRAWVDWASATFPSTC